MSAANVLFYTSILSAIPNILQRNAQLKLAYDMQVATSQYNPYGADEVFDYVIVGGGSAGCVLANRLSRNQNNRVLLLDIGGDPDPVQSVPLNMPLNVRPETDLGYYTVEQDNSFHGSGNKLHNIRGRGLGGSGNLNYMVYQRGPGKGYDEWADLTGNRIWAWENVLTFFKKFERYRGYHQPIDPRFHASSGDLVVTAPSFIPSAEYFIAACKELGINIEDTNAGVHKSPVFELLEYKINQGQRWGPFQAFLRPALRRPNLSVYRYSRVIKVNIDDKMWATGVTYVRHGITRTVMARREVILSAGAFDSPKILLLSGIGPQQHLQSLNIPVIKDLPVGMNHQDHVATVIDRIQFDQQGVAFVAARDLTPAAFHEYRMRGTGTALASNDNWHHMKAIPVEIIVGPLSTPSGFFATGYYSTSTNLDPEIPDVQYFVSSVGNCFGNPLCFPDGPIEKLGEMTEVPDGNFIAVTLTIPHTVNGIVQLKSSDPNDDLIIDPKFFSDRSDMPRFIEGVKYVIGIFENTTTYNQIGAKLVLTVPEMCSSLVYRSDEFWECYIRFYTGTVWHPVGTCRMGKEDDPQSVVDSNLRVLGISGLRVADASIMPKIVNCNTQTPVYMIAELASHLILQDQGRYQA